MMAGQTADEGAYKISCLLCVLVEYIASMHVCRPETVRQSAKLLHTGAEAVSLFGSAVGLADQVAKPTSL